MAARKKPLMPGDPGYVNPKFTGKPNKGTVSVQPVGRPKKK